MSRGPNARIEGDLDGAQNRLLVVVQHQSRIFTVPPGRRVLEQAAVPVAGTTAYNSGHSVCFWPKALPHGALGASGYWPAAYR
jgi:hypothetical protein